jgi:hypothetical protein
LSFGVIVSDSAVVGSTLSNSLKFDRISSWRDRRIANGQSGFNYRFPSAWVRNKSGNGLADASFVIGVRFFTAIWSTPITDFCGVARGFIFALASIIVFDAWARYVSMTFGFGYTTLGGKTTFGFAGIGVRYTATAHFDITTCIVTTFLAMLPV